MTDFPRPMVSSLRGVVAAAHPLAASAGARIMRAGGNAFDAAVATAAALNVVEPFMSGLAGLGMATCYVAREQRVRVLDFVPGVPASFDAAACTREDIEWGARASAIPGNLAGWARLAKDHGNLSLSQLLEPAIELAAQGFPVTRLFFDITAHELGEPKGANTEFQRVYTAAGHTPRAGFVLRQPELAETLAAIAAHGIDHLYTGPLGQQICDHLRRDGGFLTMRDLESVEPAWLDPLAVDYRGFRVHTLPPPAESFQFLLTLRIQSLLDLDRCDAGSADHLDRMARAIRLAGEQRIANNRCTAEFAADLLSDRMVEPLVARAREFEFVDGRPEQWGGNVPEDDIPRRGHTTSFSTADADGNMVCITQSLGMGYGSGVVVPGTGVCMNNFLCWGDLEPESANFLAAGGRLAMCLAPSISLAENGEPVLALGTPGSYGILQTQPQVFAWYLEMGRDLQSAIDAPRLRAWDGRRLDIENRIEPTVCDELRARGHDVHVIDAYTRRVGGFHAVARDPTNGALAGAADPRRDGHVAPV